MAEQLVPWVERIVPLEIGGIVFHIELARASKQASKEVKNSVFVHDHATTATICLDADISNILSAFVLWPTHQARSKLRKATRSPSPSPSGISSVD